MGRLVEQCLVGFGIAAAFGGGRAAAQMVDIEPGRARLVVPGFEAYEAEYGSAFGRFTNQVRAFTLEGTAKISVLNLIEMPNAVIVDHRVLDRSTLRLELMVSPYFAWGQEIVVAQASAEGVDWSRVPIGGGPPQRVAAPVAHGGYFDDVLFSPTLAAIPDLTVGVSFRMALLQPNRDGSVESVMVPHKVVGRETLRTPGGPSCECWVIEQTAADGSVTRFWVGDEAPFVFRRHRDVGGKRDFVSELLAFRSLTPSR